MTRIALFSDVHGNVQALDAVRAAVAAAAPDVIAIAGDFAVNGANPAEMIDGIRELEAKGAVIVQGNTDIAVADGDYGAAYPWFSDGVPESYRIVAEWARDAIGPARLDWLRRLPSERRIRCDDGTLVLVTHASPGSQTAGFDANLDASVILDRLGRTDARVICCGHTHVPEVRDFGWKMIVNGGSAGYVFDGDATASWALLDVVDGNVTAEIKRTPFDALAASDAVSARGLRGRRLPGGHHPHGEARPMNLTTPAGLPRVVVTGTGMVTALGQDVASTWEALLAGRSGVRTITAFDASMLNSHIAAEVIGFDPSRGPRPQGAAPQRPLHAARPCRRPPGARRGRVRGPPRRGARGANRGHHRHRARRWSHVRGAGPGRGQPRAPSGSARSSSR